MFARLFQYLKNYDWILFLSAFFLIAFGLVEMYSIALSQEAISLLNFKKQFLFAGIGIISMFAVSLVDYRNIRIMSRYLYILGALALALVLFLGETIRGTTGWFSVGQFNVQPVEFAKIILIVFMAKYFSSFSVKLNPLRHLLVSGAGVMVYVALVLQQPDFGSALILFFLWTGMLAVVGFKARHIIAVGLILMFVFASGWLFFFEGYQKDRIMTFIFPEERSLDEGYNIQQATIAVGSGRLVGRGLGFGSQSQLKFLPEAQTDFIFAVVAEELGFAGVSLIIAFFGVFFYRLLINAKKTNNDFAAYFLLGSLVLIFIEMFINIGMNIGLMPVVGIALPFLSYGGSIMISTLLLLGMCQGVIARTDYRH